MNRFIEHFGPPLLLAAATAAIVFSMLRQADHRPPQQPAAEVALCDTDTDCAEKFGGNGDPE